MRTFKERSKEMDYSNLYYPFSEKGPMKMRRIENVLITIISLLIIFFGINIWISSIPTTNVNNTQNTVSIIEGSMEFSAVIGRVVEFFKSFNFDGNAILLPVLNILLGILLVIIILFSIFISILIINYLFNVIKRSREFERNIIKNDIEVASLYRKVQGSLKINKRLAEAKKAAYPKNSSSKGGDYQVPSADNLSKVEELKCMKKIDIRVNTRQKLASPKINTVYSIYLKLPIDETTSQNLIKRVENLNETVTRLAKGKVTIGGYQLTEDRQTIVFQGETPDLDDPYDYSSRLDAIGDMSEVREFYESSYKLSDFVDRQGEIDKRKELAEEWAKRTGAMLDRYLITAKMKVTRLDTNVSSSKATYTYDMALDSNLSSGFNKFDEQLDKAFKLRGSSVSVINGHLEIILPIPKEYHIPINVPTLYKQAFGEVKE